MSIIRKYIFLALKPFGSTNNESEDKMKKILGLVFCLFVIFTSSCSPDNSKETNEIPTSISSMGNKDIVDKGENYCIYQTGKNTFSYEIYDFTGQAFLSETIHKSPKIQMINDYVIDISVGFGTGLSYHKYCDIQARKISDEYTYVVANFNEVIAYLHGDLNNRQLVVKNVFSNEVLYEEYQTDFSCVDTPIIDAGFSEDGYLLYITYYAGETLNELTRQIEINH